MPTTRIRCHVLEVDRDDDWSPLNWAARRSSPRDLLPWADPYIASLVQRLEQRYDAGDAAEDLCDPFAADDAAYSPAEFKDGWPDDGWQDDAFMPRPLEAAPANRRHPPVYGGFPLLDDCGPTDVADAL
jgi:hypothetical protein